MDSATRNFAALVGVSATCVAYAICGYIGYVLLPLLGIDGNSEGRSSTAGLVAAAALAVLIAVSAARVILALRRQMVASRMLSARIERCAGPPTEELAVAARQVGLLGRVAMVESTERFSFVYGALTPRVVVSRGLLESLDPGVLVAALAHERYHVRHLDPLRALIGEVVVQGSFLLPVLAVLRGRYMSGRELAADRWAARACGSRALLGALCKALEGPRWREPSVSASLGGEDLLIARIEQLETGHASTRGIHASCLLLSALGMAAFASLLAVAMVGAAGPAALTSALSRELSPGGALLGALCLSPLLLVITLTYWRLAQRARRPLLLAAT